MPEYGIWVWWWIYRFWLSSWFLSIFSSIIHGFSPPPHRVQTSQGKLGVLIWKSKGKVPPQESSNFKHWLRLLLFLFSYLNKDQEYSEGMPNLKMRHCGYRSTLGQWAMWRKLMMIAICHVIVLWHGAKILFQIWFKGSMRLMRMSGDMGCHLSANQTANALHLWKRELFKVV